MRIYVLRFTSAFGNNIQLYATSERELSEKKRLAIEYYRTKEGLEPIVIDNIHLPLNKKQMLRLLRWLGGSW